MCAVVSPASPNTLFSVNNIGIIDVQRALQIIYLSIH